MEMAVKENLEGSQKCGELFCDVANEESGAFRGDIVGDRNEKEVDKPRIFDE
jgi:hypothetical protein